MLDRICNFFNKKKGLTVLTGAGAAMELENSCSTSTLTNSVKSHEVSGSLITGIAESLEAYYRRRPTEDIFINFEDIYQGMEELASFYATTEPEYAKEFKPAIGAFINSSLEGRGQHLSVDDDYAIEVDLAKRNLLSQVRSMVNNYDRVYRTSAENFWHNNFFRNLSDKLKLTVATLNYDTCFEQILPNYEDGFITTSNSYKIFDPKVLRYSNKHKILHLHGSINYGFKPHGERSERWMAPDLIPDLVKYDSYDLASNHSEPHFGANQAGYTCHLSSIITGLNKTDKLIAVPFVFYNSELVNSIIKNPSLLIIGYSFNDFHLNRIIDEATRIHGENRRIAIIDFVPNDTAFTHYEQASDEIDHRKYIPIKKAFNQEENLCIAINGSAPGPYISKDKCARVYSKGFKDAILKHESSIIKFLSGG